MQGNRKRQCSDCMVKEAIVWFRVLNYIDRVVSWCHSTHNSIRVFVIPNIKYSDVYMSILKVKEVYLLKCSVSHTLCCFTLPNNDNNNNNRHLYHAGIHHIRRSWCWPLLRCIMKSSESCRLN